MVEWRLQRIAWVGVIAAGVAAIFFAATNLGMVSAPLSPRYTDYAIPAAISKMRGLTDYTAYHEVAAYFLHHRHLSVDANIANALSTNIDDPSKRWIVSGDDKGLIEFVYLAFRMFGMSVKSIFILYGLLLTGSCVLYVVEFSWSPRRLALLVSVLAAFYAMLYTFGVTDQSASIVEQRFLGSLGIVPLLHIVLVNFGADKLSMWGRACLVLQIAIVILVLQLRTSEAWQVAAVFVAVGGSFVFRRSADNAKLTIVATIILCGALMAYRMAVYNPKYFQHDISTRVIWHNMVMGLSASPALSLRYEIIPFDDVSVTEAVKRHLETLGDRKVMADLFSSPSYAAGNFAGFKWSEYEIAARNFFLHIVRENLADAVRAYLWHMPQILAANVSHLAGSEFLNSRLYAAGTFEPWERREEHDRFLRLVRAVPIILLSLSAFLLCLTPPTTDLAPAVALGMVLCLATVPPFLVMPVIQYVQVLLLIVIAGIYFASIISLSWVGRSFIALVHAKRYV